MSASSSPLMANYNRLPLSFERGEEVWLEDSKGKRYIDALSGIGVCSLGHAHPALTKAIADQAGKLMHCSNIVQIPLQEELGARLCELSGMDAAFLCNSGTEANEAAIKIARKYGHDRGISNPQILVMTGAFHGRTLAALAATANPAAQAGFGPFPGGFLRVPYTNAVEIERLLNRRREIIAILLEPIQGEGGINMPDPGYLKKLRELSDEHDCLLMFDEVQTGMGRTGKWFAFQHEDIVPDVMTLAKGLGGGFPVGACIAKGQAAKTLTAGTHGTTFGGNPLACKAALTVIETIENDHLLSNAEELGQWIRDELDKNISHFDCVEEIRGEGLMIGIQLNYPCRELVAEGLELGIMLNVTADSVIRLLPPLTIHQDHAAKIVYLVTQLIEKFEARE